MLWWVQQRYCSLFSHESPWAWSTRVYFVMNTLLLSCLSYRSRTWRFLTCRYKRLLLEGGVKLPKRQQQSRQRRLSSLLPTAAVLPRPPSSAGGWRPQPIGGGPVYLVGVPFAPQASGWCSYWWFKRWLRPCWLDGNLTRCLVRQQWPHTYHSKVKHAITGVSLNSADGLWCFLHD